MKTDIDRLHKVISGEIYGRGCGKTFARCHELAGIIETSNISLIICIMTKWNDIFYLKPMIKEVFLEHNLKITAENRFDFMCNGKKIKFIVEQDFYDRTRGIDAYILFIWDNGTKAK